MIEEATFALGMTRVHGPDGPTLNAPLVIWSARKRLVEVISGRPGTAMETQDLAISRYLEMGLEMASPGSITPTSLESAARGWRITVDHQAQVFTVLEPGGFTALEASYAGMDAGATDGKGWLSCLQAHGVAVVISGCIAFPGGRPDLNAAQADGTLLTGFALYNPEPAEPAGR